LLTGFDDEQRFISTLVACFAPRIDDAEAFARTHRVLLLRAETGVGLDSALGGLPFEELAVERSSVFTYPPDVPLRTCSAEDLIVLKAFADRPKGVCRIRRLGGASRHHRQPVDHEQPRQLRDQRVRQQQIRGGRRAHEKHQVPGQ
jgi:hypothetical protein